MKTLFLFLTGILVFSAVNNVKSINNLLPIVIECPECTREFENCSNIAHKAYTAVIENAADSINSKASRFDYRAACAEARKTRDKALADCRAAYHKCCLAEAKAEIEKDKEEKEKQ